MKNDDDWIEEIRAEIEEAKRRADILMYVNIAWIVLLAVAGATTGFIIGHFLGLW